MRNKDYPFFTGLFVIAALWNLVGAGFGYFNTAYTFQGLFERELNDPRFYRLNRSTLVNLKYVKSWDLNSRIAVLSNKDEIEISRRRIKHFEEIMTRDTTE